MSIIDVAALAKLPHAKSIVWCNGCWDVLHSGHARLLDIAVRFGSSLVVGVNSDESVRRRKGFDRPIFNQRERAQLIAMIRGVDYVVVFDDDTPLRCLGLLRPDVVVKGSDYEKDDETCPEARFVRGYGGRVVYVPRDGTSTSGIVEKIRGIV